MSGGRQERAHFSRSASCSPSSRGSWKRPLGCSAASRSCRRRARRSSAARHEPKVTARARLQPAQDAADACSLHDHVPSDRRPPAVSHQVKILPRQHRAQRVAERLAARRKLFGAPLQAERRAMRSVSGGGCRRRRGLRADHLQQSLHLVGRRHQSAFGGHRAGRAIVVLRRQGGSTARRRRRHAAAALQHCPLSYPRAVPFGFTRISPAEQRARDRPQTVGHAATDESESTASLSQWCVLQANLSPSSVSLLLFAFQSFDCAAATTERGAMLARAARGAFSTSASRPESSFRTRIPNCRAQTLRAADSPPLPPHSRSPPLYSSKFDEPRHRSHFAEAKSHSKIVSMHNSTTKITG